MTLNGELFRDRVRERDLDHFLVEELEASPAFRTWFLAQAAEHFDAPIEALVRLRKSPARGDGRQTDVQLGFFAADDDLIACVGIESKVTADFQGGQALAYANETARLRRLLGQRKACSVLVAPAARLRTIVGTEHFDSVLSIEAMSAHLARRLEDADLDPELRARLKVRIALLETLCGKRSGSAWTPATVEVKRDFADAYAALAAEMLPHLTVRPSSDGPRALTRFFDGLKRDAGFPFPVVLKHEYGSIQAGTKYVNLQFTGAADKASDVKAGWDQLGDTGGYMLAGGKSLFFRIDTPAIDPLGETFAAQRVAVQIGLQAVARLAAWFDAHQTILKALLSPAPPSAPSPAPSLGEVPSLDRLDRALRDLAKRSITEFRYRPQYFIDMLDDRGGLAAARTLLAGRPSDGFTKLWELGALELTVEALVLSEPWCSSDLFTPEELATARRLLAEAGFAPISRPS
jgi:hypothetical protein